MNDSTLREWIEEHRVCFEISPHFERHHQKTIHVGFELTLCARPSSEALADPDGPEMRRLLDGLRELVARAMPPAAQYAVRPPDASIHLRTSPSWEPEVQVVAETRHGSTFAVVDGNERDDVRQACQALRRLGAQEGTWSEAGARRERITVH